jgi:hypothetical protein
MQKTWCDNCGKELKLEEKDKPEIAGDDWKPEKLVTLKMHISGTGTYVVDMDLCIKCAKKYSRVLTKPLDE